MHDADQRLADLAAENERLRAELALHREALEHMHQGLCMFDATGTIALCNRRYADILELPHEAVRPGVTSREVIRLGMEAGHYPPGKTLEQIRTGIRSQMLSDPDGCGTMVRGGRTYAVKRRRASKGRLVSTCEDITAQIEAESALRESEARLRAILNAMPDCVKIFDQGGRLVEINPKGLELLQAPDFESLSQPGYVVIPPEYLEECLDVQRRVIAGESVMWNYEVIGMQGRRLQVEAHSVPFRMPDGASAHMCISRDVSERREAENALRRSEERLRLVQEATGLADFEADPDGTAHFSANFLKQLGLPEDASADLAFDDWVHLVHPDDREGLRQLERSLAEVDAAQHEFRIRRADTGEIRWIACWLKLERDETGNLIRSIGAHLDITERRLAEEVLRQSEERLRLVHEATGLADFESGPDGLMRCSARFFQQLGLPVVDDPIDSRSWSERIHPDDLEWVVEAIESAIARRQDWFRTEFRIVRADNGETRWLACSTKMEYDENGTLVRTIGAHLDITERKRAEEAQRQSEERLRLVHEATDLADFEADPDGTAYISERFADQVGLPRDVTKLTYDEWMRFVHPDDRDRMRREIELSLRTTEAFQCQFRIIRADTGEVRWISSRTRHERDEAGKPSRSIGAHLDITDLKRTEEALRESEERFRLAAEAAGLGVWDFDAVLDRRDWSGRLRELFGIPADAVPSVQLAVSCIHPADRARFLAGIQSMRDGKAERFHDSLRIRRQADGAERWIAVSGWRTQKADTRLRRIILTVRDVTEEKTAEERVRWSASHDSLTHLANRGLFQEKLEQAIRAAAADGGAVGLVMLDMDNFKQINDTLGHDAGDMLLKMFADRLRGVVRADDTVARLGGDEFAIVVPDSPGEHALLQLTRSVQERLREPVVHAGRLLDCRVSMGASLYPMHGKTSEELLKTADMALYAAKAAGRSTVRVFEPHMREDIQRRGSMIQLARNALREDRIIPYYQPKLDLADRSVIGFEALLRWRTPRGGIGSPAALEAAFEDLEVAAEISDRMVDRVVADMRAWLDRGVAFGSVAINASAAEFRRDNFAERLLEQLAQARIPTRCLQIEVTETVFLGRGAEYVHRALALLSARGVKIALDDFGTGYASLRHLNQFPVDLIKIDQSFVRDMDSDPGDEAIISAVINLGRSLGIGVVAEGIETEIQAGRLFELGCEFGQGFLFSKPVAARRVPAMLVRQARSVARATGQPPLRLVAGQP